MPVPLADVLEANALVSLDELKAHCGIVRATTPDDLAAEDLRLVEAINWTSSWVEDNVRPMARKVETLRLAPPRGPVLKLARIPLDVTAPVEIAIDDEPQTVWRAEADGLRADFDVLVHRSVPSSPWTPDGLVLRAYRAGGWGRLGLDDPEPILLTYTGGWDCLPVDGSRNKLPGAVRIAVLDVARAWFRNEQQGTADIVSVAQPGGGPTFEVPRWMPYAAQMILTSYRPVTVLGG